MNGGGTPTSTKDKRNTTTKSSTTTNIKSYNAGATTTILSCQTSTAAFVGNGKASAAAALTMKVDDCDYDDENGYDPPMVAPVDDFSSNDTSDDITASFSLSSSSSSDSLSFSFPVTFDDCMTTTANFPPSVVRIREDHVHLSSLSDLDDEDYFDVDMEEEEDNDDEEKDDEYEWNNEHHPSSVESNIPPAMMMTKTPSHDECKDTKMKINITTPKTIATTTKATSRPFAQLLFDATHNTLVTTMQICLSNGFSNKQHRFASASSYASTTIASNWPCGVGVATSRDSWSAWSSSSSACNLKNNEKAESTPHTSSSTSSSSSSSCAYTSNKKEIFLFHEPQHQQQHHNPQKKKPQRGGGGGRPQQQQQDDQLVYFYWMDAKYDNDDDGDLDLYDDETDSTQLYLLHDLAATARGGDPPSPTTANTATTTTTTTTTAAPSPSRSCHRPYLHHHRRRFGNSHRGEYTESTTPSYCCGASLINKLWFVFGCGTTTSYRNSHKTPLSTINNNDSNSIPQRHPKYPSHYRLGAMKGSRQCRCRCCCDKSRMVRNNRNNCGNSVPTHHPYMKSIPYQVLPNG